MCLTQEQRLCNMVIFQNITIKKLFTLQLVKSLILQVPKEISENLNKTKQTYYDKHKSLILCLAMN